MTHWLILQDVDKLKTENDHLIQRQAQLHDESLYHEQQYLQIETRLKEIESENKRLKSGKISNRNLSFEIPDSNQTFGQYYLYFRWPIVFSLTLDCLNQGGNWATKLTESEPSVVKDQKVILGKRTSFWPMFFELSGTTI